MEFFNFEPPNKRVPTTYLVWIITSVDVESREIIFDVSMEIYLFIRRYRAQIPNSL